MVMTSSGVKVSVSVGEPATFDLAGYSSKSYLEIGELTTIPSFGANAALVTHSPLATGVVKKHKGFVDYGETTIEAAMDNDDLGQQIIIALNEGNIKDSDCTIRLDYPDEASRYFTGKIFAFNETVGSANSIIGISFDVKLNSPLIRFGGGDGTPASLVLSFETQNYLQEGQVLSFSDIITFSRSTTSSYFGREVDQFGNVTFPLKTAAIDEPCLAYDPATGESLGLQVFGSATNLLTYSEQFDNAAWAKTGTGGLTISADSILAPDDVLTGDKMIPSAVAGTHYLRYTFSYAASTTYTLSLFVKKGEESTIRPSIFAGSTVCTFDFDAGDFTSVASGVTVDTKNIGSGWYRISMTATSASSPINNIEIYSEDSSVGDGVSGTYIWGAQLETGSIATPYIKTEASQVTRAADLASVNDLSGWYNQTQGSVFVDAFVNGGVSSGDSNRFLYGVDTGGLTGKIVSDVGSGGNLRTSVNYNGSGIVSIISSITSIEYLKTANSFLNGYIDLWANGVLGGSSNEMIMSNFTRLTIGNQNLNNILNGYIKTLSYYPTALSAQKSQELTQ